VKPQGHIPSSPAPSDHEGADLNIRLVVRVVVVLAATLVVLVLVVAFLFHHLNRKYAGRSSPSDPIVTTAELPPLPRLQIDPQRDLQAVRAKEDLHLNQYAWVNRPQGIVQIPIERAMVLWAKGYTPSANPTSIGTNAPAAAPAQQKNEEEGTHAP
jgi:hypothetical protein